MTRVAKLKVCYGYLPNVPKINIMGKYLEKFGFKVGDPVEVVVTENKIEIKKMEVKPCAQ